MSVPSDHERRIRVLEGATYLCSPKQVHGVKVQARIDLAGWLQIDVTADESVKGWALIYNGRSIPISVDSAALVSLTEERKQLEEERDEWKFRAESKKGSPLLATWEAAEEQGERAEAAEARLVQAEEALRQPRFHRVVAFGPKGPICGDPECLACIALGWKPALRSLGDTPEKQEDIGGNRVARSKTERSEP